MINDRLFVFFKCLPFNSRPQQKTNDKHFLKVKFKCIKIKMSHLRYLVMNYDCKNESVCFLYAISYQRPKEILLKLCTASCIAIKDNKKSNFPFIVFPHIIFFTKRKTQA